MDASTLYSSCSSPMRTRHVNEATWIVKFIKFACQPIENRIQMTTTLGQRLCCTLLRVSFHVLSYSDCSGNVEFDGIKWNLHFNQNLVGEQPTQKLTLNSPHLGESLDEADLYLKTRRNCVVLNVAGQLLRHSSNYDYMLVQWSESENSKNFSNRM